MGNVVCDSDGYDPKKARFVTYFRIDDPTTVRELTTAMRNEKTQRNFPLIGILSYQQFIDQHGRVVANTRIVNWDNTVVVNAPFESGIGYYQDVRSPEFCRRIYDLMLTHCPKTIEAQRKFYTSVREDLESLLFKGEISRTAAQQRPNGDGLKPAP